VYTVKAPDLIPVPRAGQQLTTFTHGADVVARYPDTDTLYNAKVRGFQKGKYTLEFEGEERNPQTEDIHVYEVEKRFVLDGKLF
jgi:SGF29 tudor-like domain